MSPDLKYKFCEVPFQILEIRHLRKDGTIPCFTCCENYLPVQVGDMANQSIQEIWNSEDYQKIRASILDGSFRYCIKDFCPRIQSNNLWDYEDLDQIKDLELLDIIKNKKVIIEDGPRTINLSYDDTCNLECRSCRTEKIIEHHPIFKELEKKIIQHSMDRPVKLILCSSGDPFASKHYNNILKSLRGGDGLKVQIVTNGVLFDERAWNKLHQIHQNIVMVCISLDASTKSTYDLIRKGGNFERVVENIKFLMRQKENGFDFLIRLDFVVQDTNFHEMKSFVQLGLELEVDRVYFQKIINWGTFSEDQFLSKAIYLPDHPDHNAFKEALQDFVFLDPIVDFGNISEFVEGCETSTAAPGGLHPTPPLTGKFNFKNAVRDTIRNFRAKTGRRLKVYSKYFTRIKK